MDKNDRDARLQLAQTQARKVRTILADEGITFGEAVSFSSEIFQVLSVMGEVNPMLTKSLVYLALKLQKSDLANELLRQPNMSASSGETSKDTEGDTG